jgi:hypothetical protein
MVGHIIIGFLASAPKESVNRMNMYVFLWLIHSSSLAMREDARIIVRKLDLGNLGP